MLIYVFHGSEIIGVVLTTILYMLVGMMWYSPSVFGKKWMKLTGAAETITEDQKKQAKYSYTFMTISALVMAYMLGLFLKNMFVPNILLAISVGVSLWVGFVATSLSVEYLFATHKKPWSLYAINASYFLVNLILGSAILFVFLK